MPGSMVCVDASLVMRLLMSGTSETRVVALWSEWHEAGRPVVAPTLLYYEVSNALRRYVVHGELLSQEASDGLEAALGRHLGDAATHLPRADNAHHHFFHVICTSNLSTLSLIMVS